MLPQQSKPVESGAPSQQKALGDSPQQELAHESKGECAPASALRATRCGVLTSLLPKSLLEKRATKYKNDKQIGEGSFGQVYRATVGTAEVAIKALKQSELQDYLTEVAVLDACRDHPRMVLVAIFLTSTLSRLLLPLLLSRLLLPRFVTIKLLLPSN